MKTFDIVDLTYFTGLTSIAFTYTNANVILLPNTVRTFTTTSFRYTSVGKLVAPYDGVISIPSGWHNSSSATKVYVLDEYVNRYKPEGDATFHPLSEFEM